ncbi:MAG: hypothetical protein LBN07_00560 [Christensenellaceae bacterium]|jgi:thymidylate kinase|nr:hypothetical protein [Christensenellaceae bacterium]
MTGKYIIIEMTNGSGKTTAINAAIKKAKEYGHEPVFLKTPSEKNAAACRHTRNPDKIALAKINALDKAEASIKAYILTREGFDVLQDRGLISALMYNGLDDIPFEETKSLIAKATFKILKDPRHLKELVDEVADTQTEQGYQPKQKYNGKISDLQEELIDHITILSECIATEGLIMPDMVIIPQTDMKLVENNLKARLKNGEKLDGYEERHKEEVDMFKQSVEAYKTFGGKFHLINTLFGKAPEEYAEPPGPEFFEKTIQHTAGMIIKDLEKTTPPTDEEIMAAFEKATPLTAEQNAENLTPEA